MIKIEFNSGSDVICLVLFITIFPTFPLAIFKFRKVFVFCDVTSAGNLDPRDVAALLFLQIYQVCVAVKTK